MLLALIAGARRQKRQTSLFVKVNLEDLVPADHPLRPIKAMADAALTVELPKNRPVDLHWVGFDMVL